VNKTETKLLYFYDGNLLLAEKVGSQIQKIYINDGQGIVGMVRPIYDGSTLTHYQRLYYLYDSLGSVSAVTGEHGLPLTGYKYSPYGFCMNVSNDPINNLQFVGRYGGYLDSDSGLTYFWHRWYDSKDGRWISRDPKGVRGGVNFYNYSDAVGKGLGSNRYNYSDNNPVNEIDSNGYDGVQPQPLPTQPPAPTPPPDPSPTPTSQYGLKRCKGSGCQGLWKAFCPGTPPPWIYHGTDYENCGCM